MRFVEPPEWIPLLPKPGTFKHSAYGDIHISPERNAAFVRNFKDAVYQTRLPIDAEHQTKLSGALGWLVDARQNTDGAVDGRVEWNERGKHLLSDNRFMYVSPEFFEKWQAPDSGTIHHDVLIGAALTTRPYFKEGVLRSLVASEMGMQLVLSEDGSRLLPLVANDSRPAPAGQSSAPRGQETQIMPEPTTPNTGTALPPAQFTEEQIKRFTEIEAENASLRQAFAETQAQAIQAAERVTALETEARRKAFAEQASEWFGPISDHVAFMEALPTDEARTFYATQQDAHTAQLKEAGLFRERGVRGEEHGGEGATAEGQLEVLARARVEKTPGLPYHRAYAETLKEHPELYAQYESEHRAL